MTSVINPTLNKNETTASIMKDLKSKVKEEPHLKVGDFELKFEMGELGEFYINKAELELRETPEIVSQGINELRELLKNEPDLIVPTDDEEYLHMFLRPCKWYAKSTLELMKHYFTFRLNWPHVCDDLLPSKEKGIFVSGIITPLPHRCEDGARIFVIQAGRNWKPKEISLDEIMKGSLLSLYAAMAEPRTQISGVRVIFDLAGLSLTHITYLTPSFAKALVDLVQRCLPCRLKGIHVINQPFVFNMAYALFKPFLQTKLRNRLHFHGSDKASLLRHFPSKTLPERYGGSLKIPEEQLGEPLWEYFCAFEESFIEANKYGYVKEVLAKK